MDELRKLANQLRRETAKAEETRSKLYDAIRAALASGSTQREVADATGYTRETIRKITSK